VLGRQRAVLRNQREKLLATVCGDRIAIDLMGSNKHGIPERLAGASQLMMIQIGLRVHFWDELHTVE
jgi:hypothetical protein